LINLIFNKGNLISVEIYMHLVFSKLKAGNKMLKLWIYLAGPDVFFSDALENGEEKERMHEG